MLPFSMTLSNSLSAMLNVVFLIVFNTTVLSGPM